MTDSARTSVTLPGIWGPSYLTLSEGEEVGGVPTGSLTLLPEDELAASLIDAELRRIRLARRAGSHRTARVHLERLIDVVWFEPEPIA